MNAGMLRHHITIQHLISSEDSDGYDTEVWEDYYSNYAYVNQLSGSERWNAAQVNMDKTVRFILRYNSRLKAVRPKYFRIIFDSRVYIITFVDDVRQLHDTVKIDAMEVEA